jgi:type II secretory pathway component PulC
MFKAVEAALVILCLLWAGVFVFNNFVIAKTSLDTSNSFDETPGDSFEFARTGPLGTYVTITQSGIFGAAGKVGSNVATTVAKTPPTTTTITKLPLVLKATVLAGPLDPLSSATIQHKDQGQVTKTYFLGNEVFDKVYLLEVRKYEVILRNERENKNEHLPMAELTEIAANAPRNVPSPATRREARASARTARLGKTIELKHQDIQQKLLDQYQDIATKVDVKEHKDKNGKVIGLTSSNISQIELAKELGLKDNDILTTMNGKPIDSTDSILNVLNNFSGSKNFRIGIIRNGKQTYLNYSLK